MRKKDKLKVELALLNEEYQDEVAKNGYKSKRAKELMKKIAQYIEEIDERQFVI